MEKKGPGGPLGLRLPEEPEYLSVSGSWWGVSQSLEGTGWYSQQPTLKDIWKTEWTHFKKSLVPNHTYKVRMGEKKCYRTVRVMMLLQKVQNSKMVYLNMVFDYFTTVMLSGPLNVTITVPGGPGGPVNPVSPLKKKKRKNETITNFCLSVCFKLRLLYIWHCDFFSVFTNTC